MFTPYVMIENGPLGQPALFAEPVGEIIAYTPDQVPAAFAAMEAAQSAGHWLAGYASYELGYALEPTLAPLFRKGRLPLLHFGVFEGPDVLGAGRFQAQAAGEAYSAGLSELKLHWDQARYAAAFDEVMAHIQAGDFYQANLTMPISMRMHGTAAGLYGALAAQQVVGHGAFVEMGDVRLLSRSPELFFNIDGDRNVETMPMKGTAPRGATVAEDEALAAALAVDVKNRAENLMIVDLLRNDLARVSEVGSVWVPDLFQVQSYATVHQMVSRITSRLRVDVSVRDLFEGLFPCGSITGAPKIAAMQAIRRLEAGPRDAYCGAIGWMAPDGRARFNVAIRTLCLYADDEVVLNVGGGVVADSRADAEYEEALWKARFATCLLTD